MSGPDRTVTLLVKQFASESWPPLKREEANLLFETVVCYIAKELALCIKN